jgi:deazaflavin-dependent oxidoreductase (nitroreductase family)
MKGMTPMTLASFEAALEHANEIELTTTGRVTGRPVSCQVWFVRRGAALYLVPGDGTDSQWYKNLLKTPAVRLAARGAQYSATGTPITDAGNFAQILDYFRAKYGAQYVGSLYPHPNVAVEIALALWTKRRPSTGWSSPFSAAPANRAAAWPAGSRWPGTP